MLYGDNCSRSILNFATSLNPYFFGKCSTAKSCNTGMSRQRKVLILIFLENALRLHCLVQKQCLSISLNPYFFGKCSTAWTEYGCESVLYNGLNPYFFGKCSTALYILGKLWSKCKQSLNPYFFGKCSTAMQMYVRGYKRCICLNPYFFGKCSTAI